MKLIILAGLIVTTLTVSVTGLGQVHGNATPSAPIQHQADAPFAAEIAAFEAADKTHFPSPGGVLFIGSSSIRLWSTLTQDFPELPVLNRGFGGSQIADSVRYVERIVFPYQAKMIVICGNQRSQRRQVPGSGTEGFRDLCEGRASEATRHPYCLHFHQPERRSLEPGSQSAGDESVDPEIHRGLRFPLGEVIIFGLA